MKLDKLSVWVSKTVSKKLYFEFMKLDKLSVTEIFLFIKKDNLVLIKFFYLFIDCRIAILSLT